VNGMRTEMCTQSLYTPLTRLLLDSNFVSITDMIYVLRVVVYQSGKAVRPCTGGE
jgi:hypothetical protein